MPNNTLVPDKLQGYLLQVKHMLYELISLDNRIVSIEKLDDVAIEDGDTVTAIQLKSVTSSNNPIADRAVVFWKTLYNWCTYIEESLIPINTIFRFVIVANNRIEPGDIQNRFWDAHSEQEAKNALDYAKDILLERIPEKSIDKLPESYREYVQYLFEESRSTVVISIIKNMEFEVHNDSYDHELEEKFCRQTIPPEYSDVLLTFMLGWVTQKVESFTKNNKPAYISSEEYRNVLTARLRAINLNTILSAISKIPSSIEIDGELSNSGTYIKQLKLIEADDTMLLEAATDYLRARNEKVEWARRGIVTDQSFIDYYDSLYRIWNLKRRIITKDDPIKMGNSVYFQCQNDALHQKLQGIETPSFFGNGSLQELANSPAQSPKIGWHPNYIDLLNEDNYQDDK